MTREKFESLRKDRSGRIFEIPRQRMQISESRQLFGNFLRVLIERVQMIVDLRGFISTFAEVQGFFTHIKHIVPTIGKIYI